MTEIQIQKSSRYVLGCLLALFVAVQLPGLPGTKQSQSFNDDGGESFIPPQKDSFGRKLPTSGKAFLLFLGSCSGCNAVQMDPSRILAEAKLPVLLWLSVSEKQLPPEWARRRSEVFVLADPEIRLGTPALRLSRSTAHRIDLESRRVLASSGDFESPEDFVRTSQ